MKDRLWNLGRARQAVAALLLMLFAGFAYSASKPILVLGDSLSAEYGLPRGTGWVALLRKKLEDGGKASSVVNASISGETTSGGRTRLPTLLAQHHPAIVVIELGANDGLRGLPIASMKSNLHAMIEDARHADAQVLLIGMQIPPNYGRAYTDAFSHAFSTVARDSGVALVPFLLEGVATKPQLFQADRLHPVAQAQPILLGNVWPALDKLLGR